MNEDPPGAAMLPGDRAPSPAHAGGAPPASRHATWALWLGLVGFGLGFLLMFAVLTPLAIVFGVRGLREIRARPELTGRARAWTGISLALAAPFLWVGLFVALLVEGIA